MTGKLREAAKILEIELLDHVIVGEAETDPLCRAVVSFRAIGPGLSSQVACGRATEWQSAPDIF